MSSCMTASLTRIDGDASASATRKDGGVRSSAVRMDGDLTASASIMGTQAFRMVQVCRSSVAMHYLDISPKVVWIFAGSAENDVYSNTKWNVK